MPVVSNGKIYTGEIQSLTVTQKDVRGRYEGTCYKGFQILTGLLFASAVLTLENVLIMK